MPDSQIVAGFNGSYVSHDGRLVMSADPELAPNFVQVEPLCVLCQRPFNATPAMTLSEPGTDESSVKLPHSEGIFDRLPVAFVQDEPTAAAAGADCAAKTGE